MDVGPQEAVGMPVAALPKEMEIEVRDLRGEGVGIPDRVFEALPVPPQEAGMGGQIRSIAPPFEETAGAETAEGSAPLRQIDFRGMGQEDAHQGLALRVEAAKDGGGIVVAGLQEPLEILLETAGIFHGSLHLPAK